MTAVEILFIALVLVAMAAFGGTLGLCAWWSDRRPETAAARRALPAGRQARYGSRS